MNDPDQESSAIKKGIETYKELGKEGWWKSKTSKEKHSFIVGCIMLVLTIVALILVTFPRTFFGNDVADKIIGKDNDNGFDAIGNWFKNTTSTDRIISTVVTLAITFLLSYIVMVIIRLSTFKGKKAKTIGSLIRSFVKYLVILVDIFVVLGIWGVDVSTILASVGVLTLIIGLGCQSLINDIVSGLFLVFDDSFNVGDIVVIDNFRGTIKEIGLKSTKIIDSGGNIKIIGNSAITTVVNLTQELSVAICDCDISYNEDIDNVESVIKKNLQSMKKKIPALVDVSYVGIASLADSGVTLRFVGHCKEENRYQTVRDMNKWIYKLFNDNNILIPYPQIVVNPPDKKSVEPTLKDKKASEKFIREQKELSSGIGPISNLDGEDGSVK